MDIDAPECGVSQSAQAEVAAQAKTTMAVSHACCGFMWGGRNLLRL
ncbi:hypothetical protein [Sulfuritortus calidifontis]|nr:hypothetical protein [Sulfuritortus calidifontis]